MEHVYFFFNFFCQESTNNFGYDMRGRIYLYRGWRQLELKIILNEIKHSSLEWVWSFVQLFPCIFHAYAWNLLNSRPSVDWHNKSYQVFKFELCFDYLNQSVGTNCFIYRRCLPLCITHCVLEFKYSMPGYNAFHVLYASQNIWLT